MTAILQKLRSLEARHQRGDIDAVEYARLRARLKGSVEEAEPVIIDATAVEVPAIAPPKPERPGGLPWGLGLVICFAVIGLSMGLALVLFVDVTFGITIGVTLLAALTVALFCSLEEEEK